MLDGTVMPNMVHFPIIIHLCQKKTYPVLYKYLPLKPNCPIVLARTDRHHWYLDSKIVRVRAV